MQLLDDVLRRRLVGSVEVGVEYSRVDKDVRQQEIEKGPQLM